MAYDSIKYEITGFLMYVFRMSLLHILQTNFLLKSLLGSVKYHSPAFKVCGYLCVRAGECVNRFFQVLFAFSEVSYV